MNPGTVLGKNRCVWEGSVGETCAWFQRCVCFSTSTIQQLSALKGDTYSLGLRLLMCKVAQLQPNTTGHLVLPIICNSFDNLLGHNSLSF